MNETIKGLSDSLTANFEKVASAYGIPDEYHEEAKVALANEVELMAKEAGFFTGIGSGMRQGAAGALGGGGMGTGALLGAAAVGTAGVLAADAIKGLASMAINKIGNSFGASADRASYDRAFKIVMAESEILQNDPIKAKRMADTIFGFAPTVASDPNVLANILTNSIHGDSMDLQTVKAVTDLEEKLTKMKRD